MILLSLTYAASTISLFEAQSKERVGVFDADAPSQQGGIIVLEAGLTGGAS
jgi:hypothetical protein